MSLDTTDRKQWLKKNAGLRMDPVGHPELFDKLRREFHVARYRFATCVVRNKIVADIACGTGYGTQILAQCGCKRAIGIDIDKQAVQYATEIHAEENCEFLARPASHTGLRDGEVDAVVSFETLEHVPDDGEALSEFWRVLKPGGLLICSVPNNWGLSQYHVRNYTVDSFKALLDRQFRDVRLWNQNSGSPCHNNHGQKAGIVETTPENAADAECIIAVGVRR